MAVYKYTGRTATGQVMKNTVEADSLEQATAMVASMGIRIDNIEEKKSFDMFGKVLSTSVHFQVLQAREFPARKRNRNMQMQSCQRIVVRPRFQQRTEFFHHRRRS